MLVAEPRVLLGTRLRERRVVDEVRRELGAPPLDLRAPCSPFPRDVRHRNPIGIQVPVLGELDVGPRYWDGIVPIPLAALLVDVLSLPAPDRKSVV